MCITGSFCEGATAQSHSNFVGFGRPSPSHPIRPSKLAAKLALFTLHPKDGPFQVQINLLPIITPGEEAYRCNYKR